MIRLLKKMGRKTTSYYLRQIAEDIRIQGHHKPGGDFTDSYHFMTDPQGACALTYGPTIDAIGPIQYNRCVKAMSAHFDAAGIGLQEVSDALPTGLLLASLEVLAQSLEDE